MVVLAGIAGLAVDAGRMYLTRNELKSFAESAALSAVVRLDGTAEGVARARAAVTGPASSTNKWDMATKPVSNVTVTFARESGKQSGRPDDASWSAEPGDPKLYRFARVVATADLPLLLMGRGSSTVRASATAGQLLDELLPEYADQRSRNDALRLRAREDSDPVSADYAAYIQNGKGNGRRFVGMPHTDGKPAAFFLKFVPDSTAVEPEYLGPWAEKGQRTARLVP